MAQIGSFLYFLITNYLHTFYYITNHLFNYIYKIGDIFDFFKTLNILLKILDSLLYFSIMYFGFVL